MIGDIVKVTVDRPMGSYHPEYKELYYPVNYGYIDGIIAPDGEEQDAYIWGVERPVDEFKGKVIVIIHKYNPRLKMFCLSEKKNEILLFMHFTISNSIIKLRQLRNDNMINIINEY